MISILFQIVSEKYSIGKYGSLADVCIKDGDTTKVEKEDEIDDER